MRLIALTAVTALAAAIACSTDPGVDRRSPVEHGRDLFSSTEASGAQANAFTCATCHKTVPDPSDARIVPGAVLAGVVDRPTFWGGARNDLLRAINDCRYFFMGAQASWTADDEAAKAMYAYLASLPSLAPGAQAFTIVPVAANLPVGDAARGAQVFDASCRACHGRPHSGDKKLRQGIPTLPEESRRYFEGLGFDAMQVRITFVEKARHGAFLGLYGSMPPYSTESLSDADLGSLLAFLGL
jgi:thiosulfate dehydrogenase